MGRSTLASFAAVLERVVYEGERGRKTDGKKKKGRGGKKKGEKRRGVIEKQPHILWPSAAFLKRRWRKRKEGKEKKKRKEKWTEGLYVSISVSYSRLPEVLKRGGKKGEKKKKRLPRRANREKKKRKGKKENRIRFLPLYDTFLISQRKNLLEEKVKGGRKEKKRRRMTLDTRFSYFLIPYDRELEKREKKEEEGGGRG